MAKEKRVTIRMTEEEECTVRERAARFQVPVSKYIREKIVMDDVVMRDPVTVNLLRRIHNELREVNVQAKEFPAEDAYAVRKILADIYISLGCVEDVLLHRTGGRNGDNKAVTNKRKPAVKE